jgi:hypothetical protein
MVHSSTLMMEVTYSTKMLVDFKQVTCYYTEKVELFITAAVRASHAAIVLKNYRNFVL